MCNLLVISSYTLFFQFNDVLQCVILALKLSLSNPQEDGKQKRTTKQAISRNIDIHARISIALKLSCIHN